MIKHVLLVCLLAWMAIAPAIANSCAAGCETSERAALMHHEEHAAAPDVSDCHGSADEREDSSMPDGGSMAAACFVAGAVSLPSSQPALVQIDVTSEQHSLVLLPPLSFETSAPNKPPQA